MAYPMSTALEIVDRKRSHFDLCAQQEVEFRHKTTLLEDVELVHQPLTETVLEGVDLGVTVLGKRLGAPLMISGMTGGTPEAGRFNREMAALAERLGIGFGVGSQRVMLARPEVAETFQVRDAAPGVLLFGNIGIAQARELTTAEVEGLARVIGADAMCVHLNTAMEIIQERGDHDFRGSLAAIARLIRESRVEIVVKETGCGFAREAGARLSEAGARWVDVAGAGGTSWVGVETLRNRALRHLGEAFWDWGIPTAASLLELRALDLNLIASGGVRTGIQAAKALALGARAVLVGRPAMYGLAFGGDKGVAQVLEILREELENALALLGCRSPAEVTAAHVKPA